MKVYTFNEDERERAARQFLSLEDAVLVTQDGNMYDVIYKYYGCFEYTKMKLDFEDAREIITLHNYPVIFCGVEPEELIQAPSDINEPKEDISEPFFVDDVDSVLKISVDIDEEDLRALLKETLQKETTYRRGINYFVPFVDFFKNEELYSTSSYPLIMNSNDDVQLPDYGYGVPSLYYTLSRFYTGRGVIHLTVEDLENVFKATNMGNLDITKKFVEKLNIRQLGEYDKKQMTDVSDFLTEFSERERYRIDTIKEFRNLLADSAFNREVLDSLSINPREAIKKGQQKSFTVINCDQQ